MSSRHPTFRVTALATLALVTTLCSHGRRQSGSEPPLFFVDRVQEAETEFDRAQFRSFRKNDRLDISMAVGGETRRSLAPPLPSTLTFDIQVPRQPVLRFAIGASSLNQPNLPASIDFRLFVDAGNSEETCFEATVRRFQGNEWFDQEVDLSPWAGSRIKLTFETKLRPPRLPRPMENPTAKMIPLWGHPVLASRGGESEAPNLVLISVDCLRADHLGPYGYKRNDTPRIDEFAADAVVYETAVSTSSWTLPTHMSMLTGLPPSLHGATRWRKLSQSVPFLPEILAGAGYETDGVVSGAYLSQSFGFERGFHIYRVLNDPGAETIVDEALDLARRAKGGRQFLFVHILDPHWPYRPPDEFLDRLDPRPGDISNLLQKVLHRRPPDGPTDIEQVIDLYDAEVAYVDREIGRFFDELKALGLYDPSLIILTADHGEAFYEHGHWQHSETLYEEIVHIPLIVKWPGGSPVGRAKSHINQVDIFPTLLEEVGLSSPAQGATNLRQLLSETPGERRVLLNEVTWDPMPSRGTIMKVAFRTDQIKYIGTLLGPAEDELALDEIREEELYDLSRDPSEKENLISNPEADVDSFRKLLSAYLDEARRSRSTRQGKEITLDEDVKKRLEALGYIVQ